MAVVRVVTDSSCDLPAAVVAEHNITVVPLSIRFGEEEFVDGRDLTPSAFSGPVGRLGGAPLDRGPVPRCLRAGLSRRGRGRRHRSGVHQPVVEAVGHHPGGGDGGQGPGREFPVRAVDSKSVSLGLGTICIEAAKARRGRRLGRRDRGHGRGHGRPHQDPRHP